MAGIKGKITRSKGGKQKSVYLSDVLGVFPQQGGFHVTSSAPHINITPDDGLLYEVFLMMYAYGQTEGKIPNESD
jgi:hypothetical protein